MKSSEDLFTDIAVSIEMDVEKVKKAGALALLFLINQIRDKELIRKSIDAMDGLLSLFPAITQLPLNIQLPTVSKEEKVEEKKTKKIKK